MIPNIVVIAGPTASGKSDLAVRYVHYLHDNFNVDAEIINSDSIQLYRELKILTSYPTEDLLRQVRHHLYGVLSPLETSSMSLWLDWTQEKISQLHQQNKIAIICGGTGLYIDALINGISDIPKIPEEFRSEVMNKFQQLGRDRFFKLLVALDPELCKTLNKNNTQRILRAYEVASYTGKPLTSWWKGKKIKGRNVFSMLLLPPREKLNRRCLARLKKMMEAGAPEEVKNFIEKYPDYAGPLGNVIGYREIISLLSHKISYMECMQLMYNRTKQYAKRQYTWFRNKLKLTKIIEVFGEEFQP
ncbi:MAG: tRNA (adenosine(37)-N6)-dimethylallyltransferase MiaA [Holosporaceae bacterium]|nr:tRNA (adenosine(37)-N6)-dimethylallyltransferase MiaA [Holosporaceae bacterium]